MFASFFVGVEGVKGIIAEAVSGFLGNPWVQGVLYFVLVCLFTYFYTAVTFDPKNVSETYRRWVGLFLV